DEENEKKQSERKERKEKQRPPERYSAIVGGPIVVPTPEAGKGKHSIFMAVAKGPASYSSYLSDCVIYELGSDGRPLAMANLPRMVRGGSFRVQKDGG